MGLIPRSRRRPGRRRFSLNGLAIQLSAFALSFTLVALLVVTGSQAAFVEPNESVLEYVPIGAAAPTDGGTRRPAARPTTAAAETPAPEVPVTAPDPDPEPEPEPTEEPAEVVELTDSDEGTAMFAGGTPLAPGTDREKCIEVTYTGNDDVGPVLLYAASTSGDLAPYLDLTVDVGRAADGTFGGCSGFTPSGTVYDGTLAAFAAAHHDYSSGRTTWEPSGTAERRTFRFRVAVQDVAAAAGRSATFGFTWRTEAV